MAVRGLRRVKCGDLSTRNIHHGNKGSLEFALLMGDRGHSHIVTTRLVTSRLGRCKVGLDIVGINFSGCGRHLRSNSFRLCLNRIGVARGVSVSDLIVRNKSITCNIGGAMCSITRNRTPVTGSTSVVRTFCDDGTRVASIISTLRARVPVVPIYCQANILFDGGNVGANNDTSRGGVCSGVCWWVEKRWV